MSTINADTVYDVIVVGGGLGGLTVAYQLRDKNILVLEKEERLGGRARSEKVDKVVNNIGIQFFSDSDAAMVKMFDEIGVTRTHPNPKKVPFALYIKGHFYPDATKYVTPKVMWQFVKLVFRCYRKYRTFMLPLDDPRWQALVKERAKDLHTGVGDELLDLFNLFLRGSCLSKPERTSAGIGAAFGAAVEQGNIAIVDGGFQDITDRLANANQSRVVSGADVVEVIERDEKISVRVNHNGTEYALRARDVVVATPASVVTGFMPELPEAKRKALDSVVYGSLSVVSLILKKDVPWQRFYALMSDDSIFQIAIDQTRGHKNDDDSNQPIVMNFIIAPYPDETEDIRALLTMTQEKLVTKVLTDFKKVVPDSESIEECLIDSKVAHYPRGEVELSPEFFADYLPELEKSVGNIHFCGDYTHRFSFVDGTVLSAFHVARKLGSTTVASEEEVNAFFNPPKYGFWGIMAMAASLTLIVLGSLSGNIWGVSGVLLGCFSTVGTLVWPHYMPPLKQVYQCVTEFSFTIAILLGLINLLKYDNVLEDLFGIAPGMTPVPVPSEFINSRYY